MAKDTSILQTKYAENPLTADGVFAVPIKQKGTEILETAGPLALADGSTGETIDVAQIKRVKAVDSDVFIKFFVRHLDAFFDLKPGTVRLLTAVLNEMGNTRYINGDSIYLNYGRVCEYFDKYGAKKPAKGTFFSAMAELTEKGFLAPSVDTNVWFINPAVIFNGDRVRFVTELRKKKVSKSKKLEDAGQMTLLENKHDD